MGNRKTGLLALVLVLISGAASAQEIYRTVMMRAAPGKLLELIELQNSLLPVYEAVSEPRPWLIRHSQGDQWDLLLLQPIGSYTSHFAGERANRWHQALHAAGLKSDELHARRQALVAWETDIFARGPALARVREVFDMNGYFHVEMFLSLPGKRQELYRQREMENVYLAALDRPQNLIFSRDHGAEFDIFTIGGYRDLRHFSESALIPADKEDAAAKKAGFEAANRIGTYLRSLIARHQDTLANKVTPD